MESVGDYLSGVLNLVLCLSPFFLLAFAAAGVLLLNSHNKRQRAERLREAVGGIRSPDEASLREVPGAGVQRDDCEFAGSLVQVSGHLGELAHGDIAPLEKRQFRKLVPRLRAYRQSAGYGALPDEGLSSARAAELARVDSLVSSLTGLWQDAEAGDSGKLERRFSETSQLLATAISEHEAFHRRLKDAGVLFPIPQPVGTTSSTPSPSEDEVTAMVMQKLPHEKQMLFLMQYDNAKKNSTIAVLLAVFLGGIGAHRFYMGEVGWGISYLLFSWTGIPLIVGLIEALFISGRVRRYNAQKAAQIANMMMISGT